MFERSRWPVLALLLAGGGLILTPPSRGQNAPPPIPGVEVLTRGPVHEAFAGLMADPVETKLIPKKPPAPLEEMPPAEKPDGDVVWVSGYWGWDDDRNDYLWVSGVWRATPPGKEWVSGYWREQGDDWQWVPGFWTSTSKGEEHQVSYLPQPPAPPAVAQPGPKPTPESFYVPGCWVWNTATNSYAWRVGYWARVQPGYVWVADHYRWTPSGVVYIPGYWDLALKRRGMLYAPVYISPGTVTVGFVYTPAYAIPDTVIVDAMFVRPTTCHYYYGDYYEPRYRTMGYETCVVYSQRNYDSIIVYETYERRSDPTWISLQITIGNNRAQGLAAVSAANVRRPADDHQQHDHRQQQRHEHQQRHEREQRQQRDQRQQREKRERDRPGQPGGGPERDEDDPDRQHDADGGQAAGRRGEAGGAAARATEKPLPPGAAPPGARGQPERAEGATGQARDGGASAEAAVADQER